MIIAMTVYVGCLQFSPTFKSLCCAFGKACESAGHSVKYLFSYEYAHLLPKKIKENTIFIGSSKNISSILKDAIDHRNKSSILKVFAEDPPTHIYLQNFHLLNSFIAKFARKNNSLFIYHVHEPFVQNCYKPIYKGVHQYWLYFFEYYQGKLLEQTDIAIVSSRFASKLFDIRYPRFSGERLMIPLLFEDLGSSRCQKQTREYVTFVGPPLPAKGPDKLLEIARYSSRHSLGLKLQMTSRATPRDSRFLREKDLRILSTKGFDDVAFGEIIQQSYTVLAPFRRATQSATIIGAFMYGTPVVSSKVGGLPEVVSQGKTGYLLGVDAEASLWVKGIDYIKENLTRLSGNCRKYFVKHHSEKNWSKYLPDLKIGGVE